MLTAVVLTLAGSVAHAAWNLLASRAHAEDSGLFVWVYSVLSLVLLAPAALVAVLLGAELTWTLVGAGAVSALFHTAYAVSLQAAYARSDLNVTYPVARGLGPVLAAGCAVAVRGERPGVLGWLGIALLTALALLSGAAGVNAAPQHALTVYGEPARYPADFREWPTEASFSRINIRRSITLPKSSFGGP